MEKLLKQKDERLEKQMEAITLACACDGSKIVKICGVHTGVPSSGAPFIFARGVLKNNTFKITNILASPIPCTTTAMAMNHCHHLRHPRLASLRSWLARYIIRKLMPSLCYVIALASRHWKLGPSTIFNISQSIQPDSWENCTQDSIGRENWKFRNSFYINFSTFIFLLSFGVLH